MEKRDTGPAGGTGRHSDVVLRYEVLRLLRLHGEIGARPLPTLAQLAEATHQPEREIRRICSVMEALEYIKGHHSSGGDRNPSYEITVEGLVMLHKREHVFGESFFDEALKVIPDPDAAAGADIEVSTSELTGEKPEKSPRPGFPSR
ncbi:MAG: hypothetical protein HY678_05285 [Chloroflexi bacterium]|nr:hypothetical protein [Chloroflexota bacterium]